MTQNPRLAKFRLKIIFSLMRIEVEQEADGRWIAEVPEFPGAMAYGVTRAEAISTVEILVLRATADREV